MTNLTTKIKIPNDSIITEFKEHLDLELNHRILFTAPFGAGKSTFINDFEDEHKDGYRFIRLYPVNYAVSANEDIFELIKFDILYELREKYFGDLDFKKDDFSLKLRTYMFLRYKMDKKALVTNLLDLGGEICKPLGKLTSILWDTYDDFKNYSEEIKVDELLLIEEFFKENTETKGNPKEMNTLSLLIQELVYQLKEKRLPEGENERIGDVQQKNKTVLVIDDLDRLDPDHIFRLFNIFSAHTHSITGENKFGFDKVVFVCDIENIRKIYAHKYGEGVDFSGYMDKFYSVRPFIYDNFKYLTQKITAIIDQSVFINSSKEDIVKSDSVVYLLSAVLKILSKNKAINLRSLFKSTAFLLTIEKHVTIKNNIVLSKNRISLIVVFEIISEMLGGWADLEKALLKVKDNFYIKQYFDENQNFMEKYSLVTYESGFKHEIEFVIREVFKVFVAEYLKNEDKTTDGDKFILLHEFKLNVVYNLNYEDIDDFRVKYVREIGGDTNLDYKVNYDLLLIEAFRKLQEYGFIPKIS